MQASVDAEMLELATYLQDAPQMTGVSAEAAMSPSLEGNFADRDPVMPQQTADNTLQVQPPTMGA